MAFNKNRQNDFLIKYGPLDHARRLVKTGDIIERENAFKQILEDSPKESKSAFDNYFNHALNLANPTHHLRDSWHLLNIFRYHKKHMQPKHIEAAYSSPIPQIREFSITHEKAPQSLLRKAINDSNADVRWSAIQHPNAPDDVVLKGLQDENTFIRGNSLDIALKKGGKSWFTKNKAEHLLPSFMKSNNG
jgi:hypothetical protein